MSEEQPKIEEEYEQYAEGGEEEYYEEGDETGQGAEELQKSVEEMEEELKQLSSLQQQITDQLSSTAEKLEENSVYVGQVDYEATPEELQAHFAPCGTINRVTIICDRATGQAKGFAYVEFADKESVEKALAMDDSTFKGRQLKVLPKRQNVPVFVRGGGRGRGRGAPFAGRGRGAPFMGRGGGGGYYGGGGRFPGGGRGRGPPMGGRFGGRGGGGYPMMPGRSRGRGGYFYQPY